MAEAPEPETAAAAAAAAPAAAELRIVAVGSVRNAAALTAALRSAPLAEGPAMVYCSLSRVYGLRHLLTGVDRALRRQSEGTTKTKSLATEVLCCLSPTIQISDSLAAFSVQDETTAVAVVGINAELEAFEAACAEVEGDRRCGKQQAAQATRALLTLSAKGAVADCDAERAAALDAEMKDLADSAAVKKLFKVSEAELALAGGLEGAVLTALAVRGV